MSNKQFYAFSFILLPQLFYENPQGFLTLLRVDEGQLLCRIWEETGKQLPPDERTSSDHILAEFRTSGDGITIGLITMPPPRETPDPYFIALAYTNFGGQQRAYYYTLESSMTEIGTMMCMVRPSAHSNLGYGIKPDLEDFYHEVLNLVRQ